MGDQTKPVASKTQCVYIGGTENYLETVVSRPGPVGRLHVHYIWLLQSAAVKFPGGYRPPPLDPCLVTATLLDY